MSMNRTRNLPGCCAEPKRAAPPRAPKLMCGATKPPAHPEDGDGVTCRNVGKPHFDPAVFPRKFHWTYWWCSLQSVNKYETWLQLDKHIGPLHEALHTGSSKKMDGV